MEVYVDEWVPGRWWFLIRMYACFGGKGSLGIPGREGAAAWIFQWVWTENETALTKSGVKVQRDVSKKMRKFKGFEFPGLHKKYRSYLDDVIKNCVKKEKNK